MPHYGYRCRSCQREFEVLQRMSDPPEAACPECGGAGARLFYPAGILFKGSGFYKTDSRASSPSAPAAAAAPADGSAPAPAKEAAPASGDSTSAPASAPPASANGSAPKTKAPPPTPAPKT